MTATPAPLDDVGLASLPAGALARLAGLRRRGDVSVLRDESGRAWVAWAPAPGSPVLRAVLAVPGVEIFARRRGHWYRPGSSLPTFAVPALDEAVPLHSALFPARFVAEPPPEAPAEPVPLTLARDHRPKATAALRCSLGDLARFAEAATTSRLEGLRVARSGDAALVMGRPLPGIAGAERFWGERLLVPLGWRPEPDLPEPALLEALGAAEEELVVLDATGAEVIPAAALEPAGRAAIRIAADPGRRPA